MIKQINQNKQDTFEIRGHRQLNYQSQKISQRMQISTSKEFLHYRKNMV